MLAEPVVDRVPCRLPALILVLVLVGDGNGYGDERPDRARRVQRKHYAQLFTDLTIALLPLAHQSRRSPCG